MRFERDNQQDWKPEDDGQWTKEPAKRDPRFDFAPFLGPENLEDRITDVLDGKDLMDAEAYGEFAPDYVPRRGGSGERGRHEAPGGDPEEEDEPEEEDPQEQEDPEPAGDEAKEMDFQQEPPPKTVFVDEPPPRPKVIVAEPAPRVYVDPQTEYGPVEAPPPPRSGNGMKWLIAVLISAAVVLGAVVLGVFFLPDIGAKLGLTGGAEPTPVTVQGGIPENRPTAAPATQAPEPTPVPVKVYTVSATAGSGGSVTPSGQVDVEEGGSVSFSFLPADGYEISQVVIDGAGSSIQTGYAFNDVRQDHSVYVEFRKVELPPAVEEPTPEPTAEPTVEPTAEPVPEPTAEPAPEPLPEDGGANQGAPPEAGGEGELAPPEIME